MWELATAAVYDKDKVEEYLREGYEPFAISEDRGARIWFRRKVKSETKTLSKSVVSKEQGKIDS